MIQAESFLSTSNPFEEKKTLLKIALSTSILSTILFLIQKPLPSLVLFALACSSICGVVFYQKCGRDVYLLLSVTALAMGKVVSWLALHTLYLFGIVILGTVFKLTGMDRLNKNFNKCRKQSSMFHDCEATTIESFRRQS